MGVGPVGCALRRSMQDRVRELRAEDPIADGVWAFGNNHVIGSVCLFALSAVRGSSSSSPALRRLATGLELWKKMIIPLWLLVLAVNLSCVSWDDTIRGRIELALVVWTLSAGLSDQEGGFLLIGHGKVYGQG